MRGGARVGMIVCAALQLEVLKKSDFVASGGEKQCRSVWGLGTPCRKTCDRNGTSDAWRVQPNTRLRHTQNTCDRPHLYTTRWDFSERLAAAAPLGPLAAPTCRPPGLIDPPEINPQGRASSLA